MTCGLEPLSRKAYFSDMITVETAEKHVRVTIPKDALLPKRLNAFLDWLRLEETTQKSSLGESDAEQFAEEAKAEWWQNHKSSFINSQNR